MQRQQRRRYPYSEHTRLVELVDARHAGDVMRLVEERFRPYLMAGEEDFIHLERLYFNLEEIAGKRSFIMAELALFLKKMKEEHGLRCRQSVFFRYLSTAEHCNLNISENSLKALILREMQDDY